MDESEGPKRGHDGNGATDEIQTQTLDTTSMTWVISDARIIFYAYMSDGFFSKSFFISSLPPGELFEDTHISNRFETEHENRKQQHQSDRFFRAFDA